MIVGQLIVCIIAAGIAAIIWLLPEPDRLYRRFDLHSSEGAARSVVVRRDYLGGKSLTLDDRPGFQGFGAKMNVVPDAALSFRPQLISVAAHPFFVTDYSPSIGNEGILSNESSYQPLDTMTDFGLPKERCDLAAARYWDYPRLNAEAKLSKIMPDRPVCIKMNAVLWPSNRKARNTGGVAILTLVINASGGIDSCIVRKDVPAKCGFAGALRDALFESRIDPAIVGGKPARSRVDITYNFIYDRSGRSVATTVQTVGEVAVKYPR